MKLTGVKSMVSLIGEPRGTFAPEDDHLSLVTSHDRGLTREVAGLHQTAVGDRRDLDVVRLILSPAGDVFSSAVRVIGSYHQLLLAIPIEYASGGIDLDPLDFGIFRGTGRGSGLDPSSKKLIFMRTDVELLAAAVRDFCGCLLEEQASFRGGEKEPAAAILLDQGFVVEAWFEAKEAQTKPILSARLAVATSGIAAKLRKYGYHVVGKADRTWRGHAGDANRHFDAREATRTLIFASPSETASTVPTALTVAIRGSDDSKTALLVRSPKGPSIASCCVESGPLRSTFKGKTLSSEELSFEGIGETPSLPSAITLDAEHDRQKAKLRV